MIWTSHHSSHLLIKRYTSCSRKTSILDNEKLNIPSNIKRWADSIKYEGSESPVIPVNWQFAESISALKLYEATVLLELLDKKYGENKQTITINTDHAEDGSEFHVSQLEYLKTLKESFLFKDPHNITDPYKIAATNIYKTKDDKFYHLYGSMNPSVIQSAIGFKHESPIESKTADDNWPLYQSRILQLNADELDGLSNTQFSQAGTIYYTSKEFKKTEYYKENAHVDLFETHSIDDITPASWWPQGGSAERPLSGLKVLDITRVISAPTIDRTLAQFGATVLRVTSPNLPDIHNVRCLVSSVVVVKVMY
ncbi:hypothetical protein K501DRAFT_272607 [Backusella circina FSU 941]|nr:hypothetical protein K501DRAFT_272607 [Backusella circina FSU 941]